MYLAFPDVGTCGLTNKLDAKLQVAAADPPDVTEDNFELNRKQHIVSLNAKAIRVRWKILMFATYDYLMKAL